MTQIEATKELIDMFLCIINDETASNEEKAKKCAYELAMEGFTIAENFGQLNERAYWLAVMDEIYNTYDDTKETK